MNIINILSALLTPIIAITTIYIAYQQYYINKIKYKNDLYEKRLNIFRKTENFIMKINSNGEIEKEDIYNYYYDTSESIFLFENDINMMREELYKKSFELFKYQRIIRGEIKVDVEKYNNVVEQDNSLFDWFIQQNDIVKKLFIRYLNISVR